MQTSFFSCVESKISPSGGMYARFHIGFFIRGQGMTVANALRRTLLAEVPGIVISSVEFQHATHEFATLPGVQESVMDILFNLKQIILCPQKPFLGKTVLDIFPLRRQHRFSNSIFLKMHGPAEIKASHLDLPPSLACVNPDAHIATVSPLGELAFELQVNIMQAGGIAQPEKLAAVRESQDSGKFFLDPNPSTVETVNYVIIPCDEIIGSEYIEFEIWTNGSLDPAQALQFGIKKLTHLFFNLSHLAGSQKKRSAE